MAEVTFYNHDGYETMTGMVADVDREMRKLTVIKTVIPFEDIRRIKV